MLNLQIQSVLCRAKLQHTAWCSVWISEAVIPKDELIQFQSAEMDTVKAQLQENVKQKKTKRGHYVSTSAKCERMKPKYHRPER